MAVEQSAPSTSHQYGHTLLYELERQQETAALLAEANQVVQKLGEKPVRISVVNQTHSGFKAEALNNHIWVKKDLPIEIQRGSVLFELTNVIHMPKFRQIRLDLTEGKFASAEEYTRAMEKVEYEGLVRCMDIFKKINQQNTDKWINNAFSPYANSLNNGFDYYYQHLLHDNHKDYHRSYWLQLKPA